MVPMERRQTEVRVVLLVLFVEAACKLAVAFCEMVDRRALGGHAVWYRLFDRGNELL